MCNVYATLVTVVICLELYYKAVRNDFDFVRTATETPKMMTSLLSSSSGHKNNKLIKVADCDGNRPSTTSLKSYLKVS